MATKMNEIFDQRFSDEEAEDLEDEEDFSEAQIKLIEEADKAGLVNFKDWEKTCRIELEKYGMNDEELFRKAFEAITKASEATCLVKRVQGSEERRKYHEEMAKKCTDVEKKKKHENKMKNWKKGGYGTGLLVAPDFAGKGWLVVTNNHVIMNDNEAKNAEVFFDYNEDVPVGTKLRDAECTVFTVDQLVSTSLRTKSSSDTSTYDYSLLLLVPGDEEGKKFLADRATSFEETLRVQWSGGKRPLVMFSHPHGLAKRMSIGPFPECESYPVKFIKHELGSLKGSSGGNLLFSSIDDESFTHWRSGFVHYRHGHAVAWQAIGDHMREVINKNKDKLGIN